jgi:elongation factor G
VFPSQSIRGVDVRYVKQTSGPGAFAILTVDFEPTTYGIDLTIPGDVRLEFGEYDFGYQSVFGYLDGLAWGITEELGTRPDLDVRTKVILRRLVLHLVDSNEMAFRHAGRLAARAALERFDATTPSSAPGHPTAG